MRIPSFISRKSPFRRLGQAGLDSLMRDPRYTDGNHAEHDAMVNLVRRGFQLVFDEPEESNEFNERSPKGRSLLEPKRRHTLLTGTPRNTPFSDAVRRLHARPSAIETMDRSERDALGWKSLLSALNSDRTVFPSGFAEELRSIQNEGSLSRLDTGTTVKLRRRSNALTVKDSETDKMEHTSPDRRQPQENIDGCETLRRDLDARKASFENILAETRELNKEHKMLIDERRNRMPSTNDEDRRAGRKPEFEFTEPRDTEKDTPDAQRRRGGRPPRVGIDLVGRRDEMIRHRDTAQKRVQRGTEIDTRLKEIGALLNKLDIQREKAGRELTDAELRYQNCRIAERLRGPMSK